MKQVVVIGGGNTFLNYETYISYLKIRTVTIEDFLPKKDWKSNLQEVLGNRYQVLLPRMPNRDNAKYYEWKIWFERMFPFITREVILIGHSLGGIFLAKYLSEEIFPKKIKKLILVAAPFFHPDLAEFTLPNSLEKIDEQCAEIHLFHSDDDKIVPVAEVKRYKEKLKNAMVHLLHNRGHFNTAYADDVVNVIIDSSVNFD